NIVVGIGLQARSQGFHSPAARRLVRAFKDDHKVLRGAEFFGVAKEALADWIFLGIEVQDARLSLEVTDGVEQTRVGMRDCARHYPPRVSVEPTGVAAKQHISHSGSC